MVNLVNHHNRARHSALLDAMYADRKRVFVDMLKWDVPHDGVAERDEFDNDSAVYLVLADQWSGRHLASLRLLRTDQRHILGDIFPTLCAEPAPRGADIREITRLCLAPGIGRTARLRARNLLARSLVEYALLTGVKAYTGVAETGWLGQILSAGWRCRPLGLPKIIGGTLLGSLIIEIDAGTLGHLDPAWRHDAADMRVVEFDMPLAA